ncbi:MAG: imelysin family protein [Pikeienuella sp.]
MRILLLALFLFAPVFALGADARSKALRDHIQPAFDRLSVSTVLLAQAAEHNCDPDNAPLRAAWGTAFDDWIAASHLRFGPTEVDNRGFAMEFWPDRRGKTQKALRRMILAEDQAVAELKAFAAVSIAARGFYALERLLFDLTLSGVGSAEYRCKLIRAVADDLAANAARLHSEWRGRAAESFESQDQSVAMRTLFKSLSTGLQFLSEARLGAPLGTLDRPRPKRAEARLSGRSLRHVQISLDSLSSRGDPRGRSPGHR